jgi:hypothetical protein
MKLTFLALWIAVISSVSCSFAQLTDVSVAQLTVLFKQVFSKRHMLLISLTTISARPNRHVLSWKKTLQL